MPTATNVKLGPSYRLYVANTDAPTNDTAYSRATNENDLTYNASVKTSDHEMKENGGETVVVGGPITYSLSTSGARVYDDTATARLQDGLGGRIKCQVRYVDPTDESETVLIEGTFLVSEMETGFAATGAATFSVTLRGSGGVTYNSTPRALVTS